MKVLAIVVTIWLGTFSVAMAQSSGGSSGGSSSGGASSTGTSGAGGSTLSNGTTQAGQVARLAPIRPMLKATGRRVRDSALRLLIRAAVDLDRRTIRQLPTPQSSNLETLILAS